MVSLRSRVESRRREESRALSSRSAHGSAVPGQPGSQLCLYYPLAVSEPCVLSGDISSSPTCRQDNLSATADGKSCNLLARRDDYISIKTLDRNQVHFNE